jgi:hypothetical protein
LSAVESKQAKRSPFDDSSTTLASPSRSPFDSIDQDSSKKHSPFDQVPVATRSPYSNETEATKDSSLSTLSNKTSKREQILENLRDEQKDVEQRAQELYLSMHGGMTGLGTDEKRLLEALKNLSPDDAAKLKEKYKKRFGVELEEDLQIDLSGDDLMHARIALSADKHGDTAAALHSALDGFFTNEKIILERLSELSTEDRLKVTESYRKLYDRDLVKDLKHKLDANDFGHALAYLENNTALADAYKLHSAMSGIGTNEDVIRDVLRNKSELEINAIKQNYKSTFGQTLESVLNSELSGAELHEVSAYLKRDQILASIQQVQQCVLGAGTNEKRLYQVLESIPEKDRKEFQLRYKQKTGMSLDEILKTELSGTDLEKAQILLKNGKLSDVEKLHFAVKGLGTDEEVIKEVLKDKSRDAVAKIKKEYFARYGENLQKRLESELGGSDEFRTIQMLSGVPQTLEEKLTRVDDLSKFERSGLLAGVVAAFTNEDERIDAGLRAARAELKKANNDGVITKEEQSKIEELIRFANSDIDVHVETRDAAADTGATLVSAAAASAVVILSGGTATPLVAGLAMSAGSAAYTGTKILVKGNGYDGQNSASDLGVGALEGVLSFASIGFGNALKSAAQYSAKQTVKTTGKIALKETLAETVGGTTQDAIRPETWAGGLESGIATVTVSATLGVFTNGAMQGASLLRKQTSDTAPQPPHLNQQPPYVVNEDIRFGYCSDSDYSFAVNQLNMSSDHKLFTELSSREADAMLRPNLSNSITAVHEDAAKWIKSQLEPYKKNANAAESNLIVLNKRIKETKTEIAEVETKLQLFKELEDIELRIKEFQNGFGLDLPLTSRTAEGLRQGNIHIKGNNWWNLGRGKIQQEMREIGDLIDRGKDIQSILHPPAYPLYSYHPLIFKYFKDECNEILIRLNSLEASLQETQKAIQDCFEKIDPSRIVASSANDISAKLAQIQKIITSDDIEHLRIDKFEKEVLSQIVNSGNIRFASVDEQRKFLNSLFDKQRIDFAERFPATPAYEEELRRAKSGSHIVLHGNKHPSCISTNETLSDGDEGHGFYTTFSLYRPYDYVRGSRNGDTQNTGIVCGGYVHILEVDIPTDAILKCDGKHFFLTPFQMKNIEEAARRSDLDINALITLRNKLTDPPNSNVKLINNSLEDREAVIQSLIPEDGTIKVINEVIPNRLMRNLFLDAGVKAFKVNKFTNKPVADLVLLDPDMDAKILRTVTIAEPAHPSLVVQNALDTDSNYPKRSLVELTPDEFIGLYAQEWRKASRNSEDVVPPAQLSKVIDIANRDDPSCVILQDMSGGSGFKTNLVNVEGKLYSAKKPVYSEEKPGIKRAEEDLLRLESEYHALKIYEMVGAPVPSAFLSRDGSLYREYIEAVKLPDNAAVINLLSKHAIIDIFLANRDAIGEAMNNIIADSQGRLVRIDAGGALNFRAKGEQKQREELLSIHDLYSFRDRKYDSGKIYNHLSDEDLARQFDSLIEPNIEKILMQIPNSDREVFFQRYEKFRNWANQHRSPILVSETGTSENR